MPTLVSPCNRTASKGGEWRQVIPPENRLLTEFTRQPVMGKGRSRRAGHGVFTMLCNTRLQFAGRAGPGLMQLSGSHPELVLVKGLCPVSVPSRPRTAKQVRQEQHFSKQFPQNLVLQAAPPSWPGNEGSRCASGAGTAQPVFHPGPFSPNVPGGQSTRSLGRVPRSQSQELTKASAQCCLIGQATH